MASTAIVDAEVQFHGVHDSSRLSRASLDLLLREGQPAAALTAGADGKLRLRSLAEDCEVLQEAEVAGASELLARVAPDGASVAIADKQYVKARVVTAVLPFSTIDTAYVQCLSCKPHTLCLCDVAKAHVAMSRPFCPFIMKIYVARPVP